MDIVTARAWERYRGMPTLPPTSSPSDYAITA
jgi:hypothetical protein